MHCKNFAQATQRNYDPQNFLYVIVPMEPWSAYSTQPYPQKPACPGANQSYNLGANLAANAKVKDVRQLNNKYYEEDRNVNGPLVDRFLSLIPEAYRNTFNDIRMAANPKMIFIEVLNTFGKTHGTTTEEEVIKNTTNLLTPWQPHKGI